MTASASDIHVVSQTIRSILDKKSKDAWVNLSKYVSDEELAAISKFAIDTLDWHRASEEPKMPRVEVVKMKAIDTLDWHRASEEPKVVKKET